MALSSVSVVTNALRLRSFRKPTNAEEIAHPSLWSRATDYAYLLLIGVFGVLAGVIAFNILPQDEMAAMAEDATVSEAVSQEALVPYVKPDRTILLDGGETLAPEPDEFSLTPGETVAFVVTNETGEERVFGIDAMSGHRAEEMATVDEVLPRQLTLAPGETGTLVQRVGEEGVAVTWVPN
jgi:uncharacterized cupredoxin-like copper-binding protein